MYSGIKHIFFDLDDTLWDFEKNSSAVLQDLFSEYNLTQKLNVDFHQFHSKYKQINTELWRKYYKGEIDKQFLRNHRFNETFKEFAYNNYNENLEITEHYLNRSPHGTHLKKDCLDVLNYLKPKYQLHIITNGFKEVQDIKINNSGLKKFFSQIIISEEHQLTKPNEKIFRLSESLANCKKEDCVMIGDNLESDIEGALSAGWKAIWLTDTPIDGRFHQIEGLNQLKEFF
jgi:putative hydrolase of the HAD superfamily